MQKKKLALVIVSIVMTVWLCFGAGVLGAWLMSNRSDNNTNSSFDGNKVISEIEADQSSLVNKVSPVVVSVVTTQSSGGDIFSEVYESAGTGIIVSSDGYILTNKHVISGAQKIEIINSEGTRFDRVKVIGADPLNDLAILKVQDVKDLPVASLGDSGTVRVGQQVIAIGNSMGQYQNTVTGGMISGLGRPITASLDDFASATESLTDLLQTDAAINPGNSGGPLINMAGQVIGINTAIAADAQGVGFAIPINAAKGIIRGVIKSGKIEKAYLGVQYVSITPDIRAEYDISEKQGALVYASQGQPAVSPNGPASRADIKEGDIITKVNDKAIGENGGLGSLISEFLPGEKVTLTIVRDNKTKEVELTLGAYKAEQ